MLLLLLDLNCNACFIVTSRGSRKALTYPVFGAKPTEWDKWSDPFSSSKIFLKELFALAWY